MSRCSLMRMGSAAGWCGQWRPTPLRGWERGRDLSTGLRCAREYAGCASPVATVWPPLAGLRTIRATLRPGTQRQLAEVMRVHRLVRFGSAAERERAGDVDFERPAVDQPIQLLERRLRRGNVVALHADAGPPLGFGFDSVGIRDSPA